MSVISSAKGAGRPKPGPKGRVLEPYAKEVILMHREGRSMQDIVHWLSESPRSVTITRQAVHAWLKARIKKLVKLSADYANTGVVGPFRDSGAVRIARPLEKASGLDPPLFREPLRPSASLRSATEQLSTQFDDGDFRVDEFEFKRSKNPLKNGT
jgi:hypothetical protein